MTGVPARIGRRNRLHDARWRVRALGGRVVRKLLRLLGRDEAAARWASRNYAHWLRGFEPDARDIELMRASASEGGPLISVLMPVFDPDPAHLRAAIDSVLRQAYPHWELCICDDASTRADVAEVLDQAARDDARIRIHRRAANGGIAAASQDALALAGGDFIALLDHDDALAPWALYFVAQTLHAHADADLLYSDEDKLDAQGRRCAPHFKPDWNPELLWSVNYFGHLLVIRRTLVEAAGGFRPGFDGSQDYDLILRCVAHTAAERIRHVPAILYHWRQAPGSTAQDANAKRGAHPAGRSALTAHFTGQSGVRVDDGPYATTYRVRRPPPDPAPRVSIMIPTRDGVTHLRRCIDSIVTRSSYRHAELIVIDNQSRDPATLQYLAELERGGTARVLRYDHPFNYSAINNFAAAQAGGEVLLLLNDDVEVRTPDWIEELLSRLYVDGVGAVGAKLYYPDGRVQHAGVIVGLGGIAGHSHKFAAATDPGYFFRLVLPQAVSAVTGACLMVRRADYLALGGLDERNLSVAFNDVDFCLRLGERGLRCVWTPYAELVHHESLSRGSDTTADKRARFDAEKAYMRRRWAGRLAEDPHYNRNLTRAREDFSLADAPRPYMSWIHAPNRAPVSP